MTQTDLEDKLDRVIGWINNYDQKASILLAFIGVAFPLLFSSDFATNTYKELISVLSPKWRRSVFLNKISVFLIYCSVYIMSRSIVLVSS